MIKAKHKKWAKILFTQYIENQFKKYFSHFYLLNSPNSNLKEAKNIVICPNHFSYWDGFLINKIYRTFFSDKQFYILMLEEQLKRYWFFAKLGAFSIDPDNPKKIIESMNYTQDLLQEGNKFIAIYPQGVYQQQGSDSIKLKSGLMRFVKNSENETLIVPMAFSIKIGEEKLPAIYSRFGQSCFSKEINEDFNVFTTRFIGNVEDLDKEILFKSFSDDLLK